MDISRATNEKKLYICRWYFRAGFALLPFVWAINVVWFFDEAFKKPVYDEQKLIKKYVFLSGIFSVISFAVIIGWAIAFQINRAAWGAWADNISFIIPYGKP